MIGSEGHRAKGIGRRAMFIGHRAKGKGHGAWRLMHGVKGVVILIEKMS